MHACNTEHASWKDNNCNKEIDEGDVCKPQISCTDPDGDNIKQASTVTYTDAQSNTKTFKDRCLGSVGLLEGICNPDGTFGCTNENNCRRRCPERQVCNNGACVPTKATCRDDDGIDTNRAGEVTYTDQAGNNPKTERDTCIGLRFVTEHSCNVINQGRTKVLRCANDEYCRNGACQKSQAKCTDPDGTDRKTKGTTTYVSPAGVTLTFTDHCTGSSSVTEGICKVTTFIERAVPCPIGTICSDGACKLSTTAPKETSCKDTDGYDVYTKGIVTSTDETGEKTFTDKCKTLYFLEEQICRNTKHETRQKYCYKGICENGVCTKPNTVRW